MDSTTLALSRLAAAGPLLKTAVAELPKDAEPHFQPSALMLRGEHAQSVFFILVASAEARSAVGASRRTQRQAASDCTVVAGRARPNRAYIDARMADIGRAVQAAASRIEASHHAHRLHILLGDAQRLEWMIDNVHALDGGEYFCAGDRMDQRL